MDKRLKRLRRRPAAPSSPPYEVGYGKPPKNTRFQPGNPGPGKRHKKTPEISVLAEERVKSIILQEAYRVLRLHDGKRPVKLSVVQAAARHLGVAAAKGQIRATLNLVELVMAIETEGKAAYDDFTRTAIEYKREWTEELARRTRVGSTQPDPIPHPDDIIINMQTGAVEIRGPMTPEQKRLWDQAPEVLKDIDEELAELAEMEKTGASKEFVEDERKGLLRFKAAVAQRIRKNRR